MKTHTIQSTSLVTCMLTTMLVAPFASTQSGSTGRTTPAGQPRGAAAQDPQSQDSQRQDSQRQSSESQIRIVSHDKIVGTEIYLRAKRDQRSDDQRSNDRPYEDRTRRRGEEDPTTRGRGERGVDPTTRDRGEREEAARDAAEDRADGESVGSISDLVIDRESGKLNYAVIASNTTLGFGGQSRLIDWKKIQWHAESERCTLDMSPDQFAAQPHFDADQIPRSIRAAIAAGETQEQKGREQEGDKPAGRVTADPRGQREIGTVEASAEATSDENRQHKHVLVSKVTGYTMKAQETGMGSVHAVLIEPNCAQAAFLTIGTGGMIGLGETDRPIPWSALRWTLPRGDEDLTIQVNKAERELESAPKLGKEGVDLNQKPHREKVYEFYGVEKPEFETAKQDEDKYDRNERNEAEGKRAGGREEAPIRRR